MTVTAPPGRRLVPSVTLRFLTIAGVAAVAAQLYGLYRPTGPPALAAFPQIDKLEHALGFAVPVALLLTMMSLRGTVRIGARVAVIVLFAAHAVISEVIQHFFYTYRTGDPYDVLADWTGILIGVGSSMAIRQVRRRSQDRNGRADG